MYFIIIILLNLANYVVLPRIWYIFDTVSHALERMCVQSVVNEVSTL